MGAIPNALRFTPIVPLPGLTLADGQVSPGVDERAQGVSYSVWVCQNRHFVAKKCFSLKL